MRRTRREQLFLCVVSWDWLNIFIALPQRNVAIRGLIGWLLLAWRAAQCDKEKLAIGGSGLVKDNRSPFCGGNYFLLRVLPSPHYPPNLPSLITLSLPETKQIMEGRLHVNICQGLRRLTEKGSWLDHFPRRCQSDRERGETFCDSCHIQCICLPKIISRLQL